MAVVATINTNFTATTGELEKGTKRVGQAVSKVVSGITAGTFGNINQALGAVKGLVAYQIGKSLVSAIAGGIQQLDQVAKSAKNLGLAPDQLQSLGFAAEMSGSNAETLERAIGKMTNKIADAADGTEEAQEAFTKLGLDFKQLRLMSVQGQFLAVADAITKAKDSTQRVQGAMDIFGRTGVELISTLVEGKQGIKALQGEFFLLSGGLGDTHFAAAELADDAMDRLKTAISGVKDVIIVSAAPGIALFANSLAEAASGSLRAATTQFALGKAYVELNKAVGDYLQELIAWVLRFRAAGNRGIADVANELIMPGHLRLAGAKAPFDEKLSQVKKDALERARLSDKSADSFEGAAKASDVLGEKWKEIMAEMDRVMKRNTELRNAMGMAGDEHPSKKAADAAAKAEKAFDKLSPGALEKGSVGAANAIAQAMKQNPVELKQLKIAEDNHRLWLRIEKRLDDPRLVLAESQLNN